MANPLAKLLEVFGTKSSAADSLAVALAEKQTQRDKASTVYMKTLSQLYESQGELGSMRRGSREADNPYFMEIISKYPEFKEWIKKIEPDAIYDQKYWQLASKYPSLKTSSKFEEAKKDTSYFQQSTLDSLIQEYGFDELEAIDRNK